MNAVDNTHITMPSDARLAIRNGQWTTPTVCHIPGYVQTNLVIVPRNIVYDLLVYCHRNRAACPVLEITDPGDPIIHHLADGADMRTDLPKYNIYRDGQLVPCFIISTTIIKLS